MEELELRHAVAVSPDLRALMEKVGISATDMRNVNLTSSEQVWSWQLYHMISLSTSGEAQRRLQNVPEGERVRRRGRCSRSSTSRR